MKAVLPAVARAWLEAGLPPGLEVRWFSDSDEALREIVGADVAWADLGRAAMKALVQRADRLRWLFTVAAGVDHLDLAQLRARGVILTNGSGVNAGAVAEYAVMGMLVAAKRYDEVVRLAVRRAWPADAPGKSELEGSGALIIGLGAIGGEIARRLAAFGVAVTGATRSGRDGSLKAGEWRARLGEFDWIVLATPATDETRAMIGAAELAAMRSTAWLVNIARGNIVDQAALAAALRERRIGGAFLDTVTPEPLPADHPLWALDNCLVTMHLAGRSEAGMFRRAAALFLANLAAFRDGRPLRNVVDLDAGY